MPEPPAFDPGNAAEREERLHHFAHALKNRLGSLWQAAKLLQSLPAGPEREQLMDLAERNYFNGARELEDLMDDFRVPRGITSLKRNSIIIRDLIEQCIENTNFRTNRKDQQVELATEGSLKIIGDPDIIRQLFEALLSNASKFSPVHSTIKLNARIVSGQVCVSVEDEGEGLTGEDLGRVFQRYAILGSRSTAGESQARSTLARAKQWAEAHGGSISAFSDGPGKGATFRVCLPQANL